ncbi:MAG: hypothetical protein WBL44_15540 [Nitrososphaeraceae archaeon]
MKINRVIVDPADGHVLLNVPISMNHIMEMMGSGMMGMSSGMKDHTMGMTR